MTRYLRDDPDSRPKEDWALVVGHSEVPASLIIESYKDLWNRKTKQQDG